MSANIDRSLNFWTEIKNIFNKISDKFDAKWQKRKGSVIQIALCSI